MPKEDAEVKLMAGKVGVHLRSVVLCNDCVKSLLEPTPYVVNERTLIPVRALSESFGLDVGRDETS